MPKLPEMVAGDPALMAAWNLLVKTLAPLLDGPQVVPPLTIRDGALFIDEPPTLCTFRTTETITARAGTTMGVGKCKLYAQRNGVLFVPTALGASVDLYNITGGSIATDVYGVCGMVDGQHLALVADCSGVA